MGERMDLICNYEANLFEGEKSNGKWLAFGIGLNWIVVEQLQSGDVQKCQAVQILGYLAFELSHRASEDIYHINQPSSLNRRIVNFSLEIDM